MSEAEANAVADVLATLDDGGDGDEWWADMLSDDTPAGDAFNDDEDDDDDGFNPFLDALAEEAPGSTSVPESAPAQPSTAERELAPPVTTAPPVTSAFALRQARLRDSRKLAQAPRRKNQFQASLRQSLRKRRGQPAETTSTDTAPAVSSKIEGVAHVLDVFAEQASNERAAGPKDWITALEEGSGDEAEAATGTPTSAALARKSADSFKFRASLRTSVRKKRQGGGSAFRPMGAPSVASSGVCLGDDDRSTLSESLRALNEAEAGLAQFSLSPTVAKPTAVKPSAVSPQSAAPAPVKPSPVAPQLAAYTAAANTAADAAEGEGAADQPQALRRKRSTVISRRVKEENVPASAPSDIIPAAVVTSRQEAMLLHNAVARADAASLRHRRLGQSVRKGGLSNQSAKLAAKWASKEIQKLVDVMVKVGSKNHDGFFETTFGVLHENTQGVFDAAEVDSVLETARSLGLVTYIGSWLMPIRDRLTPVTLLTTELPEASVDTSGGVVDEEDSVPFCDRKLSHSVRKGQLTRDAAKAAAAWADGEIRKVVDALKRLGRQNAQGMTECMFGTLYEETLDIFEAIGVDSVLNTARNQGIVSYKGDVLWPRYDYLTPIVLLSDTPRVSDESTYTFGELHRLSVRRRP